MIVVQRRPSTREETRSYADHFGIIFLRTSAKQDRPTLEFSKAGQLTGLGKPFVMRFHRTITEPL